MALVHIYPLLFIKSKAVNFLKNGYRYLILEKRRKYPEISVIISPTGYSQINITFHERKNRKSLKLISIPVLEVDNDR